MPSCGDSLRRRRTRSWPTKLQRFVRTRRGCMLLLSAVLLLYLLPLSVRTITNVARTIVISCEGDDKSLRFRRSPQFVNSEGEARPKPPCLMESSSLTGKIAVDPGLEGNLTISKVEAIHSDVSSGGEWSPLHCAARDRVAVIIPYRNRLSQLPVLFHYLLPILKRQLLHFRIFLVEQHGDMLFNKGRIMNAGFKEAMQIFPGFRCAVFHDVDLLPEDDRIFYSCPDMPRHLSVSVNEFKYKLPYPLLVGGVLNMLAEHFVTVNGYSNKFWGWGGEDDDMAFRIIHSGLEIDRPPADIARYYMLEHPKEKANASMLERKWLIHTTLTRRCEDGLNSLRYKVTSFSSLPLFTYIKIDVGEKEQLVLPWWGTLWVWFME